MCLGLYSKGGNCNNYKKDDKLNKNWNVLQKSFALLQMFDLFEECRIGDGKPSALKVRVRTGYGLGN